MIDLMPRKKPKAKPASEEPGTRPFQIRLPNAMRSQLLELAGRNETDLSEEIRAAIRKHLKDSGLWPHKIAK